MLNGLEMSSVYNNNLSAQLVKLTVTVSKTCGDIKLVFPGVHPVDVSKCWNCSILSSSPGHKARLESDNLTQNWAGGGLWAAGAVARRSLLLTLPLIFPVLTHLSLSHVQNLKITLGLQLNSAGMSSP